MVFRALILKEGIKSIDVLMGNRAGTPWGSRLPDEAVLLRLLCGGVSGPLRQTLEDGGHVRLFAQLVTAVVVN